MKKSSFFCGPLSRLCVLLCLVCGEGAYAAQTTPAVSSAWYASTTDTTKRNDATSVVNRKVTSTGLVLGGNSYDGLFGDPHPGTLKTLTMTFAGGTIASIIQTTGLNLTAIDITNFKNTAFATTSDTAFAVPTASLGGDATLFHTSWMLPAPGVGCVLFKGANGSGDGLYITFSQTPNVFDSNAYTLAIDAYGYQKTVLLKGYTSGCVKNADPLIIGTAVNNTVVKSTDFADYWVVVNNGTISVGRGTVPGKSVIGTWTDTKTVGGLPVRYIGFGAYRNSIGDKSNQYKNIGIQGSWGVTSDIIKAIPVENLIQLSPNYLMALVPSLSDTQIKGLIIEPSGNFTAALLGAVLGGLTATQIATAANKTSIQAILPATLGGMTIDVVQLLSNFLLSNLTSAQYIAMAPKLSTDQAITGVNALTPEMLAAYTQTQIQGLTISQWQTLVNAANNRVTKMSVDQLMWLANSPDKLAVVFSALSDTQKDTFLTKYVPSLNQTNFVALVKDTASLNTYLRYLSPQQMNWLSPSLVQGLLVDQLKTLRLDQIAGLNLTQIQGLTKEKLKAVMFPTALTTGTATPVATTAVKATDTAVKTAVMPATVGI